MVGGRERFGWGDGGWLVVVVEIEVEVVGSMGMSVLMRDLFPDTEFVRLARSEDVAVHWCFEAVLAKSQVVRTHAVSSK